MMPENGLLNFVLDRTYGCRHITLIDPGKQSSEIATRRAIAAVEAGSSMIFIGGSTDTPDEVITTHVSQYKKLLNYKSSHQVKTQHRMKINGKFQLFYFQEGLMPYLPQRME